MSTRGPLSLLMVASLVVVSGGVRAQEAEAAPPTAPAAEAEAEAEQEAAAPEDGGEASPPTEALADDESSSVDDSANDEPKADAPSLDGKADDNTPITKPKPDGPGALEASVDFTREPVDRLTEHYLGSTSRPVRFDWRDSWVTFGLTGSELIERNNFGSFKVGLLARRAFLGFMLEGVASYVYVVGTTSSELLGLTPYRQPSRPSRVEIDINASYPLFEGVVTPLFDFIPPSQMVISATVGGRYLFYPEILIGERRWQSQSTWTNTSTWQDIAQSLGTAQMLEADQTLLEENALGGMAVDPALVHTLAGITLDAYYQPGLFVGARALLNIPALQLVSGTQLGFWWEVSLRAGWAF
jgi:hypothetical protein